MLTSESVFVWAFHGLSDWLAGCAQGDRLALAVLLMGVAAAIITLQVSAIYRRRTLSKQRAAITENRFVAHMKGYAFDPQITGAAYRYLRDVQNVGFPILPSDRLQEELLLDQDEVEMTVGDLAELLGREHVAGARFEGIETVEDLVRHLQASPRVGWHKEAA